MKTVKIVPSICKDVDSNWEGHVLMRPFTFDEKYDFIEAIGIEVSDTGDVGTGVKNSRVKQAREIVRSSEKNYVEVSLLNKVTSEKVESFSQMKNEPELHDTLVELGGILINGLKVGNS